MMMSCTCILYCLAYSLVVGNHYIMCTLYGGGTIYTRIPSRKNIRYVPFKKMGLTAALKRNHALMGQTNK